MPTITGTEAGDSLSGTTDDDVIYGLGGNDVVQGLDGNDTIDGGSGNDNLRGDGGDDVIYGGDGNDQIYGGRGADVVYGGAGDDTLWVKDVDISAGDQIYGGDGFDTLKLYNYARVDLTGVIFGDDVEAIDTGSASARITADQLLQFSDINGSFQIAGGGTLDFTGINVHFLGLSLGPEGSVLQLVGQTPDGLVVYGGNGNDTIIGNDVSETFVGYDGDDHLEGGGGNDILRGGIGNDYVDGGDGDDLLQVFGASANGIPELSAGDQFVGGAGNDTIHFYSGNGGTLYDLTAVYIATDIENIIAEGAVVIDYERLSQFQTATGSFRIAGSGNFDFSGTSFEGGYLFFGDGDDVITVRRASVSAGGGNDHVIGADGDDNFGGDDGNDWLQGNDGDDFLWGGRGDDILEGGNGNDSLMGGGGRDIFLIGLGNGQDIINDFQFGYDKIDLTAYGFASFEEILSHTTWTGREYIIDLGDGNSLTLSGFRHDLFHAGPFPLLAAEDFVGFSGGFDIGQSIIPALPDMPTIDPISNVIEIVTGLGPNIPVTVDADQVLFANNLVPYIFTNVGTHYIAPLTNYGFIWNDVPSDMEDEADIVMTQNLMSTVTNIAQGNSVRGFINHGTMVLVNGRDTVVNAIACDQTDFVNTGSVYVINEGQGNAWFNRSNLVGGTNSGLIVVQSQHHYAFGIDWANDGTFDNQASGQLLVEGYLLTVAFYCDRGGQVINAGTIKAHSLNPDNPSYGLVFGDTLDLPSVHNSGLIEADIAIVAGRPIHIDNSGTIIGDVYLSDEDDVVESGSGTINGNVDLGGGTDRYVGGANDDNVFGGAGNDTLIGNGGNDVLDGGAGADSMTGGNGDDLYGVDDVGDLVVEGSNGGYDAVVSSISYTLGDYLEELYLTGSAAINGTGNALDNVVYGNAGDNVLSGLDGDDLIEGGAGNDTINGGAGFDFASYADSSGGIAINLAIASAQNTGGAGTDSLIGIEGLVGSAYADMLTGNATANIIFGRGGADVLDGGAGTDQLDGGEGGDIYLVRSSADHGAAEINDSGKTGTDEVRFAATTASTLTLYANDRGVERVVIGTGTGVNAATGGTTALNVNAAAVSNALNMTGNNGANILTGTAFGDTLSGLGGDDILKGGSGNDTLNGGSGLDKMYGGLGDDTYIVTDITDYAYEYVGEGHDLVQSSVSLTLRANVEDLTLTGSGSIWGKGNELDNVLTGNSGSNKLYGFDGNDTLTGGAGNDRLDGGVGADSMYGGSGNDVFYIDDAGDKAIELLNQGIDLVYAGLSHTLGSNIENLTLTGTVDLIGKGNGLDNLINGNEGANKLYGFDGDDRLYGRTGNDVLDGGAGVDRMWGGEGDDIYYVHDATDYTYEYAGEGHDRVYSDVSLVLRANVEDLVLTGSANNYGWGNAENNLIFGNGGANKLYGLGGADTLSGGAGNDWLEGGAGRDRMIGGGGADDFVFRDGDFAAMTTGGADQISDFSQADGDRVRLNIVDANTTLGGDQAFAFIGTTAFHGIAGELRYEQLGGNTYVMGDTNGDGNADFWIRLDGLHTLGNSDFVL